MSEKTFRQIDKLKDKNLVNFTFQQVVADPEFTEDVLPELIETDLDGNYVYDDNIININNMSQNPDDDLRDNKLFNNIYPNIKDPKCTIFKHVLPNIQTHFRSQVRTIESETNTIEISSKDYSDINAIADLSVILKIPSNYKSDFKTFCKDIKLTFKIGTKILIELEGWAILELLKMQPTLYQKTDDMIYNTNEFVIPLQSFIMGRRHLITQSFNDSMFIIIDSSIKNLKSKVCFESFKLTREESVRYQYLTNHTFISSYYVKKYELNEGKLEISLDLPIIIRNIILCTYQDISANFDGIELLRGDNTFFRYWNTVVPSDCSYYYNSGASQHFKSIDTVENGIITGFVVGKDKKITITTNSQRQHDSTMIYLIIRYDDILMNPNKNPVLAVRLNKVQPYYENYYPLTTKDGSFIEGYWFSDDICSPEAHNYPFPKETNIQVDENFLKKLSSITKEWANEKRYFGFSSCRICKKNNGSLEYLLEKDGQTFRYPEGLLHYYVEHCVQPSSEFYDFVMKF